MKKTSHRRGIILEEANPMSGVFRTIDPPPLTARRVCPPPAFGAGGGQSRWVERGWGVISSEDVRHCSVLYICKYFVPHTQVRGYGTFPFNVLYLL
jgi:hypothetical protein